MTASDDRFNRRLVGFVLTSLVFTLMAIALRLGLDRTAYETLDAVGGTMGFNDRFSAEHYMIALGNFVPADLLAWRYCYEWALLAVQAIGLLLTWRIRPGDVQKARRFFAAQFLLFPMAVPGMLIAPMMIASIFTCDADRESFVDLPFFICTVQPVWLLVSLTMVLALRGPGLGLSKIGPALRHGCGLIKQRLA